MVVPEAAVAAAAAAALGREGLLAAIRIVYDPNRYSATEMFALVNKLSKMHTEESKLFVISAIKEGQDDDPEQAKYIMFYRAPLERDILQATCRETIYIVDKQLLPFSRAAENTVLCTNTKADAYSSLAMLKVDEDHEQLLIDKALTDYEATSKAAESLFEVHALRHALHLTKTALFSDVKEWSEMATALAKLALDKAGPELASIDERSYKKIAETIGIMEDNLKTAEIMGLTDEKLELWEPTSPSSKDYSEPSSENSISPKLASLSLEEEPSYSGGSPSPPPPPVVPCPTGPPVPPEEFISPGDWGYEVHEVLMSREIRFRKKAAQIPRGFMG